MIKRISFLFCAVLLMVAMLAVPAFATEVQNDSTIKIVKQPVDFTENSLHITFSVVVSGDVASYQWQKYSGGRWSNNNGLDNSGLTSTYVVDSPPGNSGSLYRCVITGTDGTVLITDTVGFYYNKTPFIISVKQSISFVLNWVGSVINSLVSSEGALYPFLPILTIGIAVTAVLLVVKIFKSFSWGL